MENPQVEERSWYKKKRYIIPLGAFGLIMLLGASSPESTPTQQVNAPLGANLIEAVKIVPIAEKVEEKKVQKATTVPKEEKKCNSNYSGCLKPDASDYDCAGGSGNGPYYTGKVQVIGYDEYDLDRDNDGWGCE